MRNHRHHFYAVAGTNYAVCACGSKRPWWEFHPAEEPFRLNDFASPELLDSLGIRHVRGYATANHA